MSKRMSFVVLGAALLCALVPATLTAARPAAATCSSPTLTGPASATVGETYTVTGCGFKPGSLVPLEITEAGGCCFALNKVADADGRLSYTGEVWASGTYRVRASVRFHKRWRVAASWSFQAYS